MNHKAGLASLPKSAVRQRVKLLWQVYEDLIDAVVAAVCHCCCMILVLCCVHAVQ